VGGRGGGSARKHVALAGPGPEADAGAGVEASQPADHPVNHSGPNHAIGGGYYRYDNGNARRKQSGGEIDGGGNSGDAARCGGDGGCGGNGEARDGDWLVAARGDVFGESGSRIQVTSLGFSLGMSLVTMRKLKLSSEEGYEGSVHAVRNLELAGRDQVGIELLRVDTKPGTFPQP
jgi:hypothetical protein